MGPAEMEIRKINASVVAQAVRQLFIDCNYYIGEDITRALENAREKEESPVGKTVLSQLLENNEIAAKEQIPICQDTGMSVLFVEYGDKAAIEGGSFEDAVQEGVRQAYEQGYLRKSVVSDPVFDRVNTKDNTPASSIRKSFRAIPFLFLPEARASAARTCPLSKCLRRPMAYRV